MASDAQSPVPARPKKPDPMECCRRGCYPCIFDYYDTATERWEARVRAIGLDPDAIPVED